VAVVEIKKNIKMDSEKGEKISIAKTETKIKRRNVLIALASFVIILLLFLLVIGYRKSSSFSTFGGLQEGSRAKGRIYFIKEESKDSASIYSIGEEGDDEKLIYKPPEKEYVSELNVSPDGQFVMFQKSVDLVDSVYIIKSDGKGMKGLGKGRNCSFSHNGKYAMFDGVNTDDEDEDEEKGKDDEEDEYQEYSTIKIVDLGSASYKIVKEMKYPMGINSLVGFSSDDKAIVFYDQEKGYFMRNIEKDDRKELTNYTEPGLFESDSPDGKKRLLISFLAGDPEMRSISISNKDGSEKHELGKYKLGLFLPLWHKNGMRLLIAEHIGLGRRIDARILELNENRTKVINESKIIVKGPFYEIAW
jgi:Tol biopolymer transport system component